MEASFHRDQQNWGLEEVQDYLTKSGSEFHFCSLFYGDVSTALLDCWIKIVFQEKPLTLQINN